MSDDSEFGAADFAGVENPDQQYREHPGFNQSTANALLNKSPRHAFEKRKRAMSKPTPDPEHTRDREKGTMVHKVLLGSKTGYRVLDFEDYKTKVAQQERAACELSGVTPILKPDLERVYLSANKLREQLAEVFGIELDGDSETEHYWTEQTASGPLQCKAKLDHVREVHNGVQIIDLKSGDSANPKQLVRRILDQGYHVQAACYSRGLIASKPAYAGRVEFIDLFIETEGLNMCTPIAIVGGLYELGEHQWLKACSRWAHCVHEARYPGYTETILAPECPKWALEQQMAD